SAARSSRRTSTTVRRRGSRSGQGRRTAATTASPRPRRCPIRRRPMNPEAPVTKTFMDVLSSDSTRGSGGSRAAPTEDGGAAPEPAGEGGIEFGDEVQDTEAAQLRPDGQGIGDDERR